jgi:hypothetical protein
MWPKRKHEYFPKFRSVSETGAIRHSGNGTCCHRQFGCLFDFGMGAYQTTFSIGRIDYTQKKIKNEKLKKGKL